MIRRRFITYGLMLVGFSRRAWAQISGVSTGPSSADVPIRYAPLTRVVRVPLDALTTPWRPTSFVAEAMAPATAKGPARRVLISGVLFRKAAGEGRSTGGPTLGAAPQPPELSALCVTCPHEQCQVDLVTDPARLARMTGGTAAHPMFECGCHFSVFDALEDGARLSGETPRGLYRFRIRGVDGGFVEIHEVEEQALFEV